VSIEISNETEHSVDEVRVLKLAGFALDRMKIHPGAELAIMFVDEPAMEALHIQWMDEPGPTDVLSFPMDEMKPNSASNGPGIIGDIVLCPVFAEKNGKQSLEKELELLTVHGVLHLLGYDHQEILDEEVMFKLQEDFLNQWRMKV